MYDRVYTHGRICVLMRPCKPPLFECVHGVVRVCERKHAAVARDCANPCACLCESLRVFVRVPVRVFALGHARVHVFASYACAFDPPRMHVYAQLQPVARRCARARAGCCASARTCARQCVRPCTRARAPACARV
eukprot:6200934-Pleurochrysis_carterae.AAC.6